MRWLGVRGGGEEGRQVNQDSAKAVEGRVDGGREDEGMLRPATHLPSETHQNKVERAFWSLVVMHLNR